MKQKRWQVSVFDKTSKTIKDDTFYTTDTEAYLIFELIDENFTPDTATVTVYNVNGKATINVDVEVVGGIVRYEIPVEAIGHNGVWQTHYMGRSKHTKIKTHYLHTNEENIKWVRS